MYQGSFQAPLKIGIDVSGRPFNNVFVGLSSVCVSHANDIEKEFKKKFDSDYKFKKKASELNKDDLIEVIKFLDENKVHMGSLKINQHNWENWKRIYQEKQWFKEKIFGIHYTHLLKQFTSPRYIYKHKYDVVCCQESYLNINKVLDVCRRIAGVIDRDFDLSFSNAKHNFSIKFADYVSGACRKVPIEELKKFRYLKIIYAPPDISFFNKVFKK